MELIWRSRKVSIPAFTLGIPYISTQDKPPNIFESDLIESYSAGKFPVSLVVLQLSTHWVDDTFFSWYLSMICQLEGTSLLRQAADVGCLVHWRYSQGKANSSGIISIHPMELEMNFWKSLSWNNTKNNKDSYGLWRKSIRWIPTDSKHVFATLRKICKIYGGKIMAPVVFSGLYR